MLSFSFNGIRKDYIHMLRGRKRPPWPTLARNILTVPGRPGGYLQGTEIQPRIIEVPIAIRGQNISDLQKLKEDLASWLVTDEPKELVFDDEPDRTYYAVVDETIDFDEIAYLGQGTVRFLCPDPFKYGPLRMQTINVPPASFSRNSIAYLSDGTQVAANQPRFEQGGVLVEGGTTNLIPSALAKNLTSAWTSGTLNGTYTLSVRGGTGQVNISGGYTGSVAVGQTLTFNVSNTTITLTPANGTPQFVQLEQKPYATSFVDGTRSAETLTLPTDGVLNPEEGTIECFVNVNDVLKRVDGTFRVLWYAFPVGGIANGWFVLDHDGSGSRWRIATGNPSGNKAYFVPDSYTPNGWHLFSITYNQKSKSIKFFIDGVLRLSVSDAFLPSSYGNFFIGLAQENARWANAIFGPLRLSRIARSDAEILDAYQNGFTVDEYTTAYLPFDGSLEVQTPNVVENKGTADADPVFTLYVQQPTTFAMIQNQDNEYMMIGKPADAEQTTVNTRTLILDERGETLDTWSSSPTQIDAVDAVVTGSFGTDGVGITVASYGTGENWHGPALIKEVPVTQDFEVEMLCEAQTNRVNETFRIEFYLFDESMNVIGKMNIWDNSIDLYRIEAEGRYGPFVDTFVHYVISGKNYQFRNWDYYRGVIRMRREGNTFEFYTARINDKGTHYYTLKLPYVDSAGEYLGRLKYVQIHIGTFGSTGYPGQLGGSFARINRIRAYALQKATADQTPYIAYPGDVITFDHATKDILINGESRKDLKDFGARFFKLKKGANPLIVYPFDAFTATCNYRERYI